MKDAAAVLVAAGQSSRMQAFKPMLPLGRSTLISRAVHTLLDAGVQDIVAVTGNNAQELQAHLAGLPVRCVFNPSFETCQMIDSAKLGFSHISADARYVFFLPGDVPLFLPQTLEMLLCRMQETCARVVKPAYLGQPGHPILLDAKLVPQITSYAGGGGLAGALREYAGPIEQLECADPGVLLDADTPEDYEKMKVYYESIYKK